MITIVGFPFPPSENKIFKIITIKGILRKAKSKEYTQYCNEVTAWAYKNKPMLDAAKKAVSKDSKLNLKAFFYSSDKWIRKDGMIKKRDVANFLKASIDRLCELLEIDDSRLFTVSCTKQVLIEDSKDYVNFFIDQE